MPRGATCSLISKAITIVGGSTPLSAISPRSRQTGNPHNPVSTVPGEGHRPRRHQSAHCGGDRVRRNDPVDCLVAVAAIGRPERAAGPEHRLARCASRCDDLSGTVLAGYHQPLRVWVLCLYFMGLNLSNRQIAAELGLSTSDVQLMTEQLRNGLVTKAPEVSLSGDVEVDEVYVVAGHKGQPAAVAKRSHGRRTAGLVKSGGPHLLPTREPAHARLRRSYPEADQRRHDLPRL